MKQVQNLCVLLCMLLVLSVVLIGCGGSDCNDFIPPPPIIPPGPVVPPGPGIPIVRAQIEYWNGNIPGLVVPLPLINGDGPPPPAVKVIPCAQFRVLAQTVTIVDGCEVVEPIDPINIPRIGLGGYPGSMDQWYDPHCGWFYHLDSSLPQIFCAAGTAAGCPYSFSYVVGIGP